MVPRPTHDINAPEAKTGDWNTIKTLMPYLWPHGEWGIKARVVTALICLAFSKIATVMVPVFYKDAVDLISEDQDFVVTALFGILIGIAGGELRGIILPPETRCNELFTYLVPVKSVGLPTFCGLVILTDFLNTLGI